MATVDKNFRIKHGLVVEGTTATVNGQDILTKTGGDQYILDLIGGETLVKSVASGLSVNGAGELSINRTIVDGWYDASGAATTAQQNAEDYADSLASNYDPAGSATTAENNAKSYADGLASNYDASGAATTAENNAKSYADGLASNYDAAGAATTAENNAKSYADSLASNYDPAGSASTAQQNAEDYTDTMLTGYTPTSSLDTTIDGYGYLKSADLFGYATESYVGTAIDNLVDGAPGLLDTLNEIAAAINDDANYATTMTTALAGKQDELTASTGITIDGSNNISVTANTYDAYGAAATAQSNAEDYADGLASNYDPAGSASTAESNANSYTDGYVGDVLNGTEAFTAINLNSVSMQKAAQATLSSISTGSSMISWAKSDYGTAKAWVKFATATHSQVSEVLLTTDASNNVAITEFAEVGTNGSLGTVTASYLAGNIAIEVDTVYANTTVTVVATLIK